VIDTLRTRLVPESVYRVKLVITVLSVLDRSTEQTGVPAASARYSVIGISQSCCRDPISYGNQAVILQAWGRLEEALALLKKEEALCLELGNKDGLQASYGNQALILRAWGQLEVFRTSWDKVFDAVEQVVTWGLAHRTLGPIEGIGVDEIHYAKGHQYLTLVYQIDVGITRLLWVGKERTIESFQGFFTTIGQELASKIVFVCSDMWGPCLKVVREHCSDVLQILDRFHIVAKKNHALDEVRAEESRRLAREGQQPVLKSRAGCFSNGKRISSVNNASGCAICSATT
jgi:Transposase